MPFAVEIAHGAPPSLVALDERAALRDGADNVCARIYRHQNADWIDWLGLGVFEFSRNRELIRAWPARGTSHEAVLEHARHRLTPLLLQTRNHLTLHAAAVEIDGAAVAIAGRSGSGKSTLACAIARRGHPHLADDAVVIASQGGAPSVLHLPFRVQLRGQAAIDWPTEATVFKGSRRRSPLAAIVLLERSAIDVPPSLVPIDGPSAWVSIIRHAHVFDEQDPDARKELVDGYARLTKHIPAYRLTYFPRFAELGELASMVELIRRSATE